MDSFCKITVLSLVLVSIYGVGANENMTPRTDEEWMASLKCHDDSSRNHRLERHKPPVEPEIEFEEFVKTRKAEGKEYIPAILKAANKDIFCFSEAIKFLIKLETQIPKQLMG